LAIPKLSEADFEREVLASELPVLVDLYADWCAPCKQMEPVLEELANELKGKFIFVLMGNNQHVDGYLWDVNYYNPGGHNDDGRYARGEVRKNAFVAKDVEDTNLIRYSSHTIFFNLHTPYTFLAWFAYGAKVVSRVWRIDDQGQWDWARGNYAHHLASDHVTQNAFHPSYADRGGDPFEYMMLVGGLIQ